MRSRIIRWQTLALLYAVVLAVFTLIVVREERTGGACHDSHSYSCQLISPTNLPTDYLVIVGIGGVFVAIFTLKSIHHQSVQVRKQTKILKESVDAALLNAQSLINSERAWILTDIGWAANQPNQPEPTKLKLLVTGGATGETTAVVACWNWKNDGRTPAWITDKLLWVRIYDQAPPPVPDTSHPFSYSGQEPIGVGQTSRIFIQPWFRGKRPEAGAALIVYGVIKYRDAFGIHETWCGYTIEGPSDNPRLERMTGYPEYNKNT